MYILVETSSVANACLLPLNPPGLGLTRSLATTLSTSVLVVRRYRWAKEQQLVAISDSLRVPHASNGVAVNGELHVYLCGIARGSQEPERAQELQYLFPWLVTRARGARGVSRDFAHQVNPAVVSRIVLPRHSNIKVLMLLDLALRDDDVRRNRDQIDRVSAEATCGGDTSLGPRKPQPYL